MLIHMGLRDMDAVLIARVCTLQHGCVWALGRLHSPRTLVALWRATGLGIDVFALVLELGDTSEAAAGMVRSAASVAGMPPPLDVLRRVLPHTAGSAEHPVQHLATQPDPSPLLSSALAFAGYDGLPAVPAAGAALV